MSGPKRTSTRTPAKRTRAGRDAAKAPAVAPVRPPVVVTPKLRHHPSLKDMASDHIRLAIVSGELRPGQKVDQDEVAEVLGISRLPVREALIELTAKGYVVSVPRRGAFVVRLSAEDILDHFRVLGTLFALTASRAAETVTDEQLDMLRALHEQIVATDDFERSQELDVEFYRIINRLGSSDRLLAALQYFALALPNDYYMFSPARRSTEDRYRTEMLAALEARDPAVASEVAEEHLRLCGTLTVEALEDRGYWSAAVDAAGEAAAR